MAAVNYSPSGFSYAQAARGRSSAATSQTPSSKVTSGTATPATGLLSDTPPSTNWADDVEATVEDKSGEPQKARQEETPSSQPTESTVDQAKSEDKAPNGTSGTPSPDLPASSSTTTKEDDSSSAPNGSSSESTWETKSQTSEPAWIADRKERQSSSHASDKTVKPEKKSKDSAASAPSSPMVLQDAPPPPVNPWAKRAEEAKAKMAALPKPAPVSDASALKENQRPRADSRRKANSIASIPRESLASAGDGTRTSDGVPSKRGSDGRNNNSRQDSRLVTDETRSDRPKTNPPRSLPSERQSLPNLTTAPPSVKDETSWPTPDTAQEKERKETAEKEKEEKREDDGSSSTKRKKPEWTHMAVTPNIVWETQSMNERKEGKPRATPSSDRPGRNGVGSKGRGGYRGTPNGATGADRQSSKPTSSPQNQETDSATQRPVSTSIDSDNMPPPPRPTRASSAGPRRSSKQDYSFADNIARGQNGSGPAPSNTNATDASKTETASLSDFTKPFSEARRARSPKKMNASGAEPKDDEIVPKPIPRRNSLGTQTEEASAASESITRDAPPIRLVPSDGRKEPRNHDSFRESAWSIAPRGSKRGGRGRGGNGVRELGNGHPAAHAHGNNFPADFAAAPYGIPPSPSTYQAQRGNHQISYPSPGRGGWRGNPRSQSIPIDSYYQQRFGGSFAGGQHPVPSLHTYVPGMYDVNGGPWSAIPFQPQMETQYLLEMVRTQLEYYFSIDNLIRDTFLRKHMDSQGFVFLDVVIPFKRLKEMTQDKDLIKAACISSDFLEIRVGEDGKERLRKREGWEQWLLPIEQRDPGAQTDGPERLERPERPQLSMNNIPPQLRGPASAGLPHMHQRVDRRSYDSGFPMINGMPAQYAAFGGYPESMYGEMLNGEETRGRAAKSPIHETSVSPSKQNLSGAADGSENEPDAFPDEQASVLTVVIKMSPQRIPFHSAASRTFSNGSIDSRSILSEIEKPAEARPEVTLNGDSHAKRSDSSSGLGLTRHMSPSNARSSERSPKDPELHVYWVKEQDKDMPVEQLPSGLTSEPYVQLRLKALEQRNQAATGTCPYDLDVLYQFWCHFLIRNFNNRMYTEFQYYANEDAKERHNFTGLQNLVKFYSQSLSSHNPIRDRVVKDYVELVKNEPAELKNAAFKELRGAWRNGALNLKNRKKLADIVSEVLKEKLDKTEP